VGKIFKPPLRRDAAEKAFAEALAPLSMLGAGVDIAVADDATRGTLATIRLTGDVDDAAVSQAEEIMAAYTMSHKIVRAR